MTIVADPLRGNAHLVDALGSALRSGEHGFSTVPGLLKRVLVEQSWREFVTQRGERVQHERFADFVVAKPLRGIGASMNLIDRIVGTSDPELLRMLHEAKKGRPGRPRKDRKKALDSSKVSRDMDAEDADRLAHVAPREYEAVRRGERTINAAAVAAGIRKRRISVQIDSPASTARTLRRHMAPEQVAELVRLLGDGGTDG